MGISRRIFTSKLRLSWSGGDAPSYRVLQIGAGMDQARGGWEGQSGSRTTRIASPKPVNFNGQSVPTDFRSNGRNKGTKRTSALHREWEEIEMRQSQELMRQLDEAIQELRQAIAESRELVIDLRDEVDKRDHDA